MGMLGGLTRVSSFLVIGMLIVDDLKKKKVNGNLSLLQYIHFHFINFLFFSV